MLQGPSASPVSVKLVRSRYIAVKDDLGCGQMVEWPRTQFAFIAKIRLFALCCGRGRGCLRWLRNEYVKSVVVVIVEVFCCSDFALLGFKRRIIVIFPIFFIVCVSRGASI